MINSAAAARTAPPAPPKIALNRTALWFGQTGGAIAWTLHLMLTYAVGEWGCAGPLCRKFALGVTGTAWTEVGVSLLCVAITVAALFAAGVSLRRLLAVEAGRIPLDGMETDTRRPGYFLACSGLVTSGVFLLVIAAQTVPIFFFLRNCGG